MDLHFLPSLLTNLSPSMLPNTQMLNPSTRNVFSDSEYYQVCSKHKKHSDKRKHKSKISHISQSSAEEDESSVHVKKLTKSQHKVPPEPQLQDSTDPVFYREVDMSDLPSQYTEEVETFRQILDLPDPRETLHRSSTTVLGLDDEKGQQELRPRGPAMLPLNPFEKFEQDFLAFNLPEGKYTKPPASTAKYYKVGQPCFEDKLQEHNTDFAKYVFLPSRLGPVAKVPLQVLKERKYQSRQNLSTVLLQLLLHATLFWRRASTVPRLLSKGPKIKFWRVPTLKGPSDGAMKASVTTLNSWRRGF